MSKLIISLYILFTGANIQAKTCTQYCTEGVSYGCGNACIPVFKHCRKDWTSTCPASERPAKKSTAVDRSKIKHVDIDQVK